VPFDPQTAEDLMVKAARCCCLCRQFKGQKLEVHHIVPEANGGPSTPDNGLPVCFGCHADVESYNNKHPRGRKYRPEELKRLRDEWFKLVTEGKVSRLGKACHCLETKSTMLFGPPLFATPSCDRRSLNLNCPLLITILGGDHCCFFARIKV
jgi:hypothetical protein